MSTSIIKKRVCLRCGTPVANNEELRLHVCKTASKTIWRKDENGAFVTTLRRYRACLTRKPARCVLPLYRCETVPAIDHMTPIEDKYDPARSIIRWEGEVEGNKVIILNI